MLIALIIVSVIAVAEAAFIFWLVKVLKNTFSVMDACVEIMEGKTPVKLKTAYNNKYYPATVIAQVSYNMETEMKVVDWSKYEDKKIVGFIVHTTKSLQDYYGDDLDEEEIELLNEPVVIPNVLVYEVEEGVWMWKSAE